MRGRSSSDSGRRWSTLQQRRGLLFLVAARPQAIYSLVLNINSVSVGCAPCVTLCSLEDTEISERGAEPQGGWNVEPGSSHCLKKGRDECGERRSDPCGVPGVVVVSRLSMPPSGALLSKASSRWEAESGAVNKAPRGWVPSHVHLQLHQGRFLSGHAPSQLRNISE